MASSLSTQCTPLKHAYDQCFNSWFEGYLQPAIEESQPSNASSSSTSRKTGNGIKESSKEETRRAYSKRKAEEFEEKCGKVWESYRACISVSLFFFIFSPLKLCLLILLRSRSDTKPFHVTAESSNRERLRLSSRPSSARKSATGSRTRHACAKIRCTVKFSAEVEADKTITCGG